MNFNRVLFWTRQTNDLWPQTRVLFENSERFIITYEAGKIHSKSENAYVKNFLRNPGTYLRRSQSHIRTCRKSTWHLTNRQPMSQSSISLMMCLRHAIRSFINRFEPHRNGFIISPFWLIVSLEYRTISISILSLHTSCQGLFSHGSIEWVPSVA